MSKIARSIEGVIVPGFALRTNHLAYASSSFSAKRRGIRNEVRRVARNAYHCTASYQSQQHMPAAWQLKDGQYIQVTHSQGALIGANS